MKGFATILILVFLVPLALADITTGLVGYWKFDENSGTSALDSSGSNLTGTLSGSPLRDGGYTNNDINFDGTNDDVNIVGSSLLNIDRNMTVSLWFFNWVLDEGDILQKGVGLNGYVVWYAPSQARKILWGKQGADISLFAKTTTDFNASGNMNKWFHLVGVTDVNQNKIYVNGVFEGNSSAPSNYTNNGNLYFGNGPSGDGRQKGKIDEIRIYNRPLSQADINQLYYCQPPTLIARDWIINGNTNCTTADLNTSSIIAGGNVDIQNGSLTLAQDFNLSVRTGKSILIRKTPLMKSWLWLKKRVNLLVKK